MATLRASALASSSAPPNTPLQIGVNALVFKNPMTGVAKRVVSLYAHIPRLYPGSVVTFFTPHPISAHTMQIFFNSGIDFVRPEFRLVITPVWGLKIPVWKEVAEWWWLHFRLPLLLRRHGVRIYEAPWGRGIPPLSRLLGLLGKRLAMIITVHDLIPLGLEENLTQGIRAFNIPYLRFKRFFYRLRMTVELSVADRIITVSPKVREDIFSHFPSVDPAKVVVLSNGISGINGINETNRNKGANRRTNGGDRKTKEDCWDYIQRHGVANGVKEKGTKKFLFYVGGFNPRKNLPRLLRGFEQVSQGHALVIAGKENFYFRQEIQPLINTHSRHIVRLGYLSERELPRFYRQAAWVCYPSLAEGFGMPPLEALSVGGRVLIDRNLPINQGGKDGESFLLSALKETFSPRTLAEWWQEHVKTIDWRNDGEIAAVLKKITVSKPPSSEQGKKIWGNRCPLTWENLAKTYGSWLSEWVYAIQRKGWLG